MLSVLLFVHFHGEGSALSNFDAFHLSATCIYLFCFSSSLLPTCSSYISFDPSCVFTLRTGLAGRLCSLFYYSRCCTLLTRLARSLPSFPPFFFFTYFPENLLGLSVYRAVIVKPIAFFPLSKHKFFHVPSPSLSIVFCSRSIALFAHRS